MKFIYKKIILSFTLTVLSFTSIAAEISQAQIEQFKKMSPSQQQALASSMGIDLSTINVLGNKSTNNSQQSSPSLNELVPEPILLNKRKKLKNKQLKLIAYNLVVVPIALN